MVTLGLDLNISLMEHGLGENLHFAETIYITVFTE